VGPFEVSRFSFKGMPRTGRAAVKHFTLGSRAFNLPSCITLRIRVTARGRRFTTRRPAPADSRASAPTSACRSAMRR
jgi:hypothetical protein